MVEKVPYEAGPAPATMEAVPRYVEHELHRIADALNATEGILLYVEDIGTITMSPTAVYENVFVGEQALVEVPPGLWDAANGIFYAPADGIYQYTYSFQCYDPTGNGSQAYELRGQVTRSEFDGSLPQVIAGVAQGQPDSMSGIVTLSQLVQMAKGQRLTFQARAEHVNRTEACSAFGSVNMVYRGNI